MAWIKYPPRWLTWHIERDQWYFQLGHLVLLSYVPRGAGEEEAGVIRRRPWLSRLWRVPGLVRAHHRAGLPWHVAVRVALLILR